MFRYYSKVKNNSKVRVTVVGVHQDGELKLATARCGAKDNFVKKFGRKIAEGRLEKGKLHTVVSMATCTGKEFFDKAHEVAKEVMDSKVVYKQNNVLV